MPQADGRNKLAHIEFIFDGNTLNFAVNPEHITYTQPQRVTVVKTQSNFVTEDFGHDPTTITIKGLTGMFGGKSNYTGQDKMSEIKDFFDYVDYQNTGKYGQSVQKPLFFMNHTDNYNVNCVLAPQGYSIVHDVQEPLLYRYEINLLGLGYAEDYVDKAQIEKTQVVVPTVNKNSANSLTTPLVN